MRLDAIAMVPMFLTLGWLWPSQRCFWLTIWREFRDEVAMAESIRVGDRVEILNGVYSKEIGVVARVRPFSGMASVLLFTKDIFVRVNVDQLKVIPRKITGPTEF